MVGGEQNDYEIKENQKSMTCNDYHGGTGRSIHVAYKNIYQKEEREDAYQSQINQTQLPTSLISFPFPHTYLLS